jgi:ABC-type bacteriocin/lantibiotic exporter with double-glycine peptidase domain
VAAARAFIREAELLVFDDLSSALDIETEKLLWQRLGERQQKRLTTYLVVSHRREVCNRPITLSCSRKGELRHKGPWRHYCKGVRRYIDSSETKDSKAFRKGEPMAYAWSSAAESCCAFINYTTRSN